MEELTSKQEISQLAPIFLKIAPSEGDFHQFFLIFLEDLPMHSVSHIYVNIYFYTFLQLRKFIEVDTNFAFFHVTFFALLVKFLPR